MKSLLLAPQIAVGVRWVFARKKAIVFASLALLKQFRYFFIIKKIEKFDKRSNKPQYSIGGKR
ncbi:hypothetical protein CKA32_005709 [Geitlerinema sp. FC II]|nr:hypothetical protein CKA32_005709 [Geitlerinema sp. FC II]